MVHDLDVVQLQRHEALVAARQGLLRGAGGEGILDRGLGLCRSAGVLRVVVVATRGDGAAAEEVREGAAAGGGGGGLVGVAADLLLVLSAMRHGSEGLLFRHGE